jgi:predicted nuclease of predicted toxin-antitoxin system
MQQGRVVDLDASLPLADSVIFATARRANADLWTQDVDFKGLPGVHYFPKR